MTMIISDDYKSWRGACEPEEPNTDAWRPTPLNGCSKNLPADPLAKALRKYHPAREGVRTDIIPGNFKPAPRLVTYVSNSLRSHQPQQQFMYGPRGSFSEHG